MFGEKLKKKQMPKKLIDIKRHADPTPPTSAHMIQGQVTLIMMNVKRAGTVHSLSWDRFGYILSET